MWLATNIMEKEDIDYTGLSDNPKVIEMLKEKVLLERKIRELDEYALILLEFRLLAI